MINDENSNQLLSGCLVKIINNADITMSLSANGSMKAPSEDCWFSLRAR